MKRTTFCSCALGLFAASFALLCLSAACAEGTAKEAEPGESAGGGSEGEGGDENSASTGGDTGAGGTSGYPEPTCAAPVDLGVRIVGRHAGCQDGAVQMAWSGTGFVARFDGTGLSFTQSGSGVEYTVVVDGEVMEKLATSTGEQTYQVASGLVSGEHQVEIYRRSEASFGTTNLLGVEVEGGDLLDPPVAPDRQIEIFGDSITCGYGNEGASTSCSFSMDTENHYMTYGAILARSFGAELSTVAWSGKGVVSNYGGDRGTTLPEMVDRALPATATSVWDYSQLPSADLVIVNLGTNDFSTDADPTPDAFMSGYLDLLRVIRARHPSSFILCTLGPLLSGTDLSTAASAIQSAIAELAGEGDDGVAYHAMLTGNPSPGCDWHPSIATHEMMAEELSGVVADALAW